MAPNKNIVVVIPLHNQKDTVELCASMLLQGSRVPNTILVVDDHSDPDQKITLSHPSLVVESASGGKGRSSTRNQGIRSALAMGADIILFMDGDTIPEDSQFVMGHVKALDTGHPGKMHFSTRRHIPRPLEFTNYLPGSTQYVRSPCSRPPSDYLTANMDALYRRTAMTDQDLRVVSGTVDAYNATSSFDEKCDLMLSGMVAWSCNFSMDAEAAAKISGLMKSVYQLDGWFDDAAFSSGWGYEDVALGIDALFAGVDVRLGDGPRVLHFMHDRSDELHSHIQGRHRIMERYRRLLTLHRPSLKGTSQWAQTLYMANGIAAYIDRSKLYLGGRMFVVPEDSFVKPKHTILSLGEKMYVDGWLLDRATGTYSASILGRLLNWLATRN
jgi:glycosyltransferase involved in cell wall biosynthesis